MNEQKAKDLCFLAHSKGSKLARIMKYLFGWGTRKREEKAFHLLSEIIENMENETQNDQTNKEKSYYYFILGNCHQNGEGNFISIFFLFLIIFFIFILIC